MSTIISTISDIAGILGFLISLFAAFQVVRLKQKISGDNNNNVNVKGTVKGGIVGRDKN